MKVLFSIMAIASICILASFKRMTPSSIYDQHFTALNNNEISLSQYQGKKMLLVNMASESIYASTQIPELEELYQRYKDSLVVIGFFSNDFNNETRTNASLKILMENTYHATFPASIQIGVKDNTTTTHLLYKWLQDKNENGVMDAKVKSDFQKYLIDNTGSIIGVFAGKISPLDNSVINAILQ